MAEEVLLSVVIPAHNAEHCLGEQLEALANQVDGGAFEVIVVDNRSTDRTSEVASSYAGRIPALRVVPAGDGRSASYARNVGLDHARGDVVVFVDADDVAGPDLLAAYRAKADAHPIMGGHYEEARLNSPKVAAWRFSATPGGLPVAFGTIPFFLMGNVAIHRATFDRLGKFDETLAHGGEEIEFAIRAKLAGIEIAWVPEAVVHYRHRSTLRGLSRQFFDYGQAATLIYARYREVAALPPTTIRKTLSVARAVIPHIVDMALGNKRRGEWVRLSSFYAGEVVESVRQRVWYLGA